MSTIHTKEYRALITKLVQAREDAGLTQTDVAEKLEVHQSFISKIETCQRRVDVLELQKFAKIYGVEISDLMQ
jgi:transcriptional regulator with XRE-family HTH domain